MRASILASSLLASTAGAFSATTTNSCDATTVRSFTLRGPSLDNECTLHEIRPSPRDPHAEEDEVEMLYPTVRRSFVNPDHTRKVLDIRQTSFGCGRLGATVWPSALALSALLASDDKCYSLVKGKRVMELGSGCGLPSLVVKEICGAKEVLATDYWEVAETGVQLLPVGAASGDRLVPKDLFSANLAYNIQADEIASVRRLDWHDETENFANANEYRPDVIIGSDLVYYPMDTSPLIQTLEILLKAGREEGEAREALLILPLPPSAEREALPDFRARLEKGELGEGCDVVMDELELVETKFEEQRHNLLRVQIHSTSRGVK